jgi:hypothetical protein
MPRRFLRFLRVLRIPRTFVLLILALLVWPRLADAELVWAITDDHTLVVFDAFEPGVILMEMPITGLRPEEELRAIDFRPRDGQLYGYGNLRHIYRIHPLTGVATPIGANPLAIAPGLSQEFGFDFDPVADEIRFIGSNLNFRVDPDTGDVIDADPATPGVQGHLIPLPIGNYVAAAYTDNYPGATTTTLFVINASTDRLARLGGVGGTPSPNLGAVTDIGPLDQPTNGTAALDAALPTDNLFAWVNSVGFSVIDKNNGELQTIGPVGPGTGRYIYDIAVLALPATMFALTEDRRLIRFKNHAPNNILGQMTISGLFAGEFVQAIALRASTGQLYGISDQGRLYRINPATAVATFLRDLGSVAFGTSFGMDFDPGTDEIRIVSSGGLNARVHPETFAVTEGAKLTLPDVHAIGYSHLPPSGSGQTLFGFTADSYVYIGGLGGTPSPDTGVVNDINPIGFTPPPRAGLDFSIADNMALAAGRIGGGDRLLLLDGRNGGSLTIGGIPNANGPVIGLAFAPRGHVQFATPTATVLENAGSATLVVQRTNGSDGAIAVDYAVTGGTATAVIDYGGVAGTLVFEDGETTKTIVLQILNDTMPETPETVIFTLSTPMLGARLGATTSFALTINDDETPPNPPPTINIVIPTDQPTYVTRGALLTLAGNASDDTGIARIEWENDRGGSGVARETRGTWTAIDIPVRIGVNVITVTATDTAGAEATDTITVTVNELTYLLAEGATGAFFDLDILLGNPNDLSANVSVTFLKEGGSTVVQTLTLPATSRTTLRVDQIAGLESTAVSAIITSVDGLPLIVERTMRWDASGYGAHTEKAVETPANTWYFAEGSQGFFSTYILLANPGTSANRAQILYLREGMSPVSRTYDLAPQSRFTVDAGADPDLVNTSFGMIVNFDTPGVAERAMYFGTSPLWKAGHESAGVTQPALEWFLAEGATGPFFETFILLANPQTTTDAEVTLTFLRDSGAPITRTKTVRAAGRLTVNPEFEDPGLANTAFGTQVVSNVPIVVERAQYWPFAPDQWYEAHNSFGTTSLGTTWGLAEGRVGGTNNYQTYILLANPGSAPVDVTITFLRSNGSTVTKSFTVDPVSRFNVTPGPGGLVPELSNEEFAAVIESSEPIAVERAMYLDVGGATWAAGTNATATRLPQIRRVP